VNAGVIDGRCFNLMPGETLCLGRTPEQDCATTHVVAPNESCDNIMQAAGINATLLHGNNPQLSAACDNLYYGQVLCVADTLRVPPVPAGGASSAVAAVSATPKATPASSVAAKVTPAPTANVAIDTGADDDDDSDLPFCDEL
jgi:hypothetical protein